MRDYDRKQMHNLHERSMRIDEVYKKEPRIRQIDDTISSISLQQTKYLINGDNDALETLRDNLYNLRKQREKLLKLSGFPTDYMEMQYSCGKCRDTGYIGNEKCHCFKQAIINLLYDQSNLKNILSNENFSTLSYAYYSKELTDNMTNETVYNHMSDVIEECRQYVDNFSAIKGNILFTGTTGVGKTFLSNCIAKSLIDRCFSVVYLTAAGLFDIFSKQAFRRDEDTDDIEIDNYILDSDLLIIDDLGTELANSFTISKLFYCVNERLLREKGTIISTNLSTEDISNIYSERISSRIFSNYKLLRLFGNDIRIIKKYQRDNPAFINRQVKFIKEK